MKTGTQITLAITIPLIFISIFFMFAWIKSPTDFTITIEINMDNQTYESISELINFYNNSEIKLFGNLTDDEVREILKVLETMKGG